MNKIILFIVAVFISTNVLAEDKKFEPEYNGQKDRSYFISGMPNTDPEVLIANSPKRQYSNPVVTTGNTPLSTIELLDKQIKNMVYDPKAKTIAESKTPEEVIESNMGNCYEVARMALIKLRSAGYEAKIVNIKVGSGAVGHSICVFKEMDGTWSLMQAGGNRYMGYTKGKSTNIVQLLNDVFYNIIDYQIM